MADSTDSREEKKPRKPYAVSGWEPLFLESLRTYGIVSVAAKESGVEHSTVYYKRKRSTTFAAAWDEAIAEGRARFADTAEAALLKNIRAGDTTAIIFALKSHRPEVYNRPTEVRHAGSEGGGAIPVALLDGLIRTGYREEEKILHRDVDEDVDDSSMNRRPKRT